MAVIIGMDPHKRSATIEVIDQRAQRLEVDRFGTDKAGYAELLAAGRKYRIGCGQLRAATASVSTSRTGWCMTARPCWTCRRSCPHRCGCSPPATAARPTRWMRTRWRDGRAADPESGCRSQATPESRGAGHVGRTAATSLAGPGRRQSTGCTRCCWSCSRAAPSSSCPPGRPARWSPPSSRSAAGPGSAVLRDRWGGVGEVGDSSRQVDVTHQPGVHRPRLTARWRWPPRETRRAPSCCPSARWSR